MKLPIVTYKDYQERGGTLSEESFETSLMHAQSWLRYVLGYNEPKTEEENEACIRATCAAIAVDAAYGASGGIGESASSMTIGSFSISGGSNSDGSASAYQADMESAIHRELIGTRLLFQGL